MASQKAQTPESGSGARRLANERHTAEHKARKAARRFRHLGDGPIKKPSKRTGSMGKQGEG